MNYLMPVALGIKKGGEKFPHYTDYQYIVVNQTLTSPDAIYE